jgi:hypothetical protein
MSINEIVLSFLSEQSDCLSKFKCVNKKNFLLFIKYVNCLFKKVGIALKPTKELYQAMKCNKKNLGSIIMKNINKVYTNRDIEKIKEKVKLFFSSISSDHTFISLDTAFINENNEINYNNLVSYFEMKNKELHKLLNMGILYSVSFNIMDDNLLPLYSSENKENTYSIYKEGKIKYISKHIYSSLIHTVKTGEDDENIEKGKFISLSSKLGQGGEILMAYFPQFAEKLEEDSGSEVLAEGVEASAIPVTNDASPVAEVVKSLGPDFTAYYEVIIIVLILALIGLVIYGIQTGAITD